ncbi:MAG: rod shape-determining protein MreC [Minisyncoccota bacterium]
MKRIFLAKRNALLSSRHVSWGIFALVFACAAFFMRLLAPNVFLQATAPLFRASDALAAGGHAVLASFSDTAKLAIQNERLQSENAALASENHALQQKSAAVSALLGSAASGTASGILAGVVARPPESPYDTLVLAAGTKDGVTLGMEAFGEGGVPIGVVSSVLDGFSRVTLFSTSGMTTSGWVGHASVPLAVLGAGAGAMNASVAREAGVAVGDVVFAPGPGQLPIGSVVRVDSNPLSPSITLRIMPAVNPFAVSWVLLRATGIVPMTFATSTTP